MKRVLSFFLLDRTWKVPAGFAALALSLLVWALIAAGSFSAISFDEEKNSALEAALNGQPPLPAIVAAREVSPEYAATVRKQIVEGANRILQSDEPVSWADADTSDVTQRAWIDAYVCELRGWRDQRRVLRKLVLDGYGECSWLARFAIRSPVVYSDAGGVFGWMLAILPWVLLIFVLGAWAMLMLVRRAYDWLYASKVF